MIVIGNTYGRWTVVRKGNPTSNHQPTWFCKCSCGAEREVVQSHLASGHSQSCGCLAKERAREYQLLRPYESLYNKLCNVAARQQREMKLTYEDFLEFTKTLNCHYCEATVTWAASAYKRNGSGYNLDRKDSALGYTRENCVVCCARCNHGKSDRFTYAEWHRMTRVFREQKERGKRRFPKQDLLGMISEIWQGLDHSLHHSAYLQTYSNSYAIQTVGSRHYMTKVHPTMPQDIRNQIQEDLTTFRVHLAGTFWQLDHLANELVPAAYKLCLKEGVLTRDQYDQLMDRLESDALLKEISERRNLSHQFAGVVVNLFDSQTNTLIASLLPDLDGVDVALNLQDRPLTPEETEEMRKRELHTKLAECFGHVTGICEGLFRYIDAKYGTQVFPRSAGFLVTIPHSYLGQIPEGAAGAIYVKVEREEVAASAP